MPPSCAPAPSSAEGYQPYARGAKRAPRCSAVVAKCRCSPAAPAQDAQARQELLVDQISRGARDLGEATMAMPGMPPASHKRTPTLLYLPGMAACSADSHPVGSSRHLKCCIAEDSSA